MASISFKKGNLMSIKGKFLSEKNACMGKTIVCLRCANFGFRSVFQVDEGNRLFDSDESNNLAWTLATIRAAFTSDIAVESVTLPGQLNFGSSFAVEWVVRNRGVNDVQGYKCDTGTFHWRTYRSRT